MGCYSQVSTGVADRRGSQEMPPGAPKASLKDKFNSCTHSPGAQGIQLNGSAASLFSRLVSSLRMWGSNKEEGGEKHTEGATAWPRQGPVLCTPHRERLGAPQGAWPQLEFKGKGTEQRWRRKKERQRWREIPPPKMSQKIRFKTQWRNKNVQDSVSQGACVKTPEEGSVDRMRRLQKCLHPSSSRPLTGPDTCYLIALGPCSLLCKQGVIKMLSYFPPGVSPSIKWEEMCL